jgi:hypothetical protein
MFASCLHGDLGFGKYFLDFGEHFIETYLDQRGIAFKRSPPYTPELNGIAERPFRTLMESVRVQLLQSALPAEFWGLALLSGCYVRSICGEKVTQARGW